jgi:hypothetical protein
MARRTSTLTITSEGRDTGKTFLITEMPASQAERWAERLLFALGRSGADIPADVLGSGFAGVAAIGLRAFAGLPWDLAEPLLQEMFTCVAIRPDPARPQVTRALVESDIEEVLTRLQIRDEVINLHVGFSPAAYLSKLAAALKTTDEPTTSMSTSPVPSAP